MRLGARGCGVPEEGVSLCADRIENIVLTSVRTTSTTAWDGMAYEKQYKLFGVFGLESYVILLALLWNIRYRTY